MVLVMLILLMDLIVMPAYTRHGSEREVPDLTGLPIDAAKAKAQKQGFEVVVEPAKISNRADPDVIIEQRPLPKLHSKPGRKIHIVPAKATGPESAPYLQGLELRDAQVRCRNVGLVCGSTEISYQFSSIIAKGSVVSQDPEEGEPIEPGSLMQLVISLGPVPNRILVPSLVEKSLHDARQALLESGLTLGQITRKETDLYTAGTIIAQSIRTGVEIGRGDPVDIVVAIPVSTTISSEDEF
jgi:eukaryotic-like serine/threonine-protein kinase